MTKKKYIINRILQLIPVLLVVSVVVFLLINLSPGDPAEIMLRSQGVEPTQEAILHIREKMGLNKPIYIRYFTWLWDVIHLDFGVSYKTGTPVITELMLRFPATLKLSLCAMIIAIVIALPLGILSAVYKGGWIDNFTRAISTIGTAMPSFWLGLLLLFVFGVKLKWFPVVGREDCNHIVLPAFTLGSSIVASYIRLLRANMLDVLSKEYIKAARAKGLKEKYVIINHALKNAILPFITLLGTNFGSMLAGANTVETIFSWNGIGRYSLVSIFDKDYAVVQGYVLLLSAAIVIINLLVDVCYVFIDPRVKLK